MIGSFLSSMFGCAHRRLTRPITPVSKPGEPSGETYVVCLDCGAQFEYDWDHMRIGQRIRRSSESGVLAPEMPAPSKTKIKYALLGTAVPLAVVLGGALFSNRRAKSHNAPAAEDPQLGSYAGTYISLPHGGPGARFPLADLIAYIRQSRRDYIIIGQVDCAFSDHPRRSSLDYWIRENFAKNKEIKQAASEVVRQLTATGLFEHRDDLRCPDTGERSAGLKLRPSPAQA